MKFNYEIVDNLLSEEQCSSVMKYFGDKLIPSKVIGEESLRTSDDHYIQKELIDDIEVLDVVEYLQNKFAKICNLPIENQELLTIIRYKVGQEFKPHLDVFQKIDMEVQSILGGQRTWTFITCLKESDIGGETCFPKRNEILKLKAGQCLFWKNTDSDGNIFEDSLHSGKTPISGEKWIVTCWVREKKYYPLDHNLVKQLIEVYPKENLIEVLSQLDLQNLKQNNFN